MKTKKNKKYYNFTEKQRRSDWNDNIEGYNPPADFVRPYNIKFRRQCKRILEEHIRSTGGYPTLYEDNVYPTIRRSASWDYW